MDSNKASEEKSGRRLWAPILGLLNEEEILAKKPDGFLPIVVEDREVQIPFWKS